MAAISSNGTGGGDWSAGASWVGGVAPTSADDVTIVSGDSITLDTLGLVANTFTVADGGTLACSVVANSAVTTERMWTIASGGTLNIDLSSTANYYCHLWHNNASSTATSYINLASGSIITLKGFPKKRWTTLDGAVAALATAATVADATGWQDGDRVVFGTTDDYDATPHTDDINSISVSGNNISWTGGLTYGHQDTGYIGNFSSNVVIGPAIAGDRGSVRLSAAGTIDNVEFRSINQAGQWGNWGLACFQGSATRVITNCPFYDFRSHAITGGYQTASDNQITGCCFYSTFSQSAVVTTQINGKAITVDNCLVLRAGAGINATSGGIMKLINSVVSGCPLSGLYSFSSIQVEAHNCELFSNRYGTSAFRGTIKTTGCDLGAKFSAGNNYVSHSSGSGETIHISPTTGYVTGLIDSLQGNTDSSFVRFGDKDNDPTKQETYTNLANNTPTIERDFVTYYGALGSSLVINTQTGVRDVEIPFSVFAPVGKPLTVSGFIRRSNGQPVAVTLSGLGLEASAYTCVGADDVWEQFNVALTNTTGSDGVLDLIITATSGSVGTIHIDALSAPTPAAVQTGEFDYWTNGLPIAALAANYVSPIDVLNVQKFILTLPGSIGEHLTQLEGLTSEQAAKLAAIPINPLLADDARLDHLDADVSSGSGLDAADRAALLLIVALLEADEDHTSTAIVKRLKGTSTELLRKEVTGSNLPAPLTLTEPPP